MACASPLSSALVSVAEVRDTRQSTAAGKEVTARFRERERARERERERERKRERKKERRERERKKRERGRLHKVGEQKERGMVGISACLINWII